MLAFRFPALEAVPPPDCRHPQLGAEGRTSSLGAQLWRWTDLGCWSTDTPQSPALHHRLDQVTFLSLCAETESGRLCPLGQTTELTSEVRRCEYAACMDRLHPTYCKHLHMAWSPRCWHRQWEKCGTTRLTRKRGVWKWTQEFSSKNQEFKLF